MTFREERGYSFVGISYLIANYVLAFGRIIYKGGKISLRLQDLVCLYIGRQILLIFCLALVKVHFLFRLFP